MWDEPQERAAQAGGANGPVLQDLRVRMFSLFARKQEKSASKLLRVNMGKQPLEELRGVLRAALGDTDSRERRPRKLPSDVSGR